MNQTTHLYKLRGPERDACPHQRIQRALQHFVLLNLHMWFDNKTRYGRVAGWTPNQNLSWHPAQSEAAFGEG